MPATLTALEQEVLLEEAAPVSTAEFSLPAPTEDLVFITDEESLFERPMVKAAAVVALAAAGYYVFTRMA